MIILLFTLMLAGCGIADAADDAMDKIDEYNEKELKLKKEIYIQRQYTACYVRVKDACVAKAINSWSLCNPESNFSNIGEKCGNEADDVCQTNGCDSFDSRDTCSKFLKDNFNYEI